MSKFLTIVGVSYWGHTQDQLDRFVYDLKCQTNQEDWTSLIYHDGYRYGTNYDDFFMDGKVKYIEVDPPKGAYGNYNKLAALDEIDSEYVYFCNIDNQYFPILVQTAKEEIDKDPSIDILAWPIVARIARGFYEPLYPEPAVNSIDYCSFIIRTSVARKVGFSLPTWSGQDGLLISEAVRAGAKFETIRAFLATHN